MRQPILMYHSVSDARPDPDGICVPPERLLSQLEQVQRAGYHGVSVRELMAATARGSTAKLVGLTFDDGYADFRTAAVPVLEHMGFTATVFAVSTLLGGSNIWDNGPRLDLIDRDGLREVAARGMEVGSHSARHVPLSRLPPDELARELAESRDTLSDAIGAGIAGFCYPYGDASAATARAVRAAGYAYACAAKDGDPRDPWRLPRRYMGNRDGSSRLRVKLALAGR